MGETNYSHILWITLLITPVVDLQKSSEISVVWMHDSLMMNVLKLPN